MEDVLRRDLQRGWDPGLTFQGTQAALISLPKDQGNQIFLLETGLITHFLLQEVTSRRQLCTCPAASFSNPDHHPDSVGSAILQGSVSWNRGYVGPKPGILVFRMTPLSAPLVAMLTARLASNNSRADSTCGCHQTVYLKSDYVLCLKMEKLYTVSNKTWS